MLKLLKIFFILGLSINIFPITTPDNFKVTIPEFIPKGKSFEVAIVTSKIFEEADQLEIYIVPGSSLFISGAEIWTKGGKTELNVSSIFLNKFSKSSYRLLVDFTNTQLSEQGTFFQILLNFGQINVNNTSFKIYGEFKKDGNVLGHLENYDQKSLTDEEYLYNFSINTYEKYEIAGKSALFDANSSLEIPVKFKLSNDLILDFWVKYQSFGKPFLKIVDEQNNRVECSLEVNEYQMFRTTSNFHEQVSLKPKFISRNAWYHINIVFSKSDSYIYLYCDDEEISKFKLQYQLNNDNLFVEFLNETNTPLFNLEQLRFFDLSGSLITILQNKNFKEFSSDSSNLLLQMNFSNSELDVFTKSNFVSYSNLKLVNSNAPIFPRAPEINLKIMSNYYEFEWTGGDYSNVSHYVLERAIGNDDFVRIAKQNADRKSEKIYNEVSDKIDRPEIVYFRVKQVNLDKTEVFSEIVKVGQGIVEDVLLEQNYPNPFNPKTQIEFELIEDSDVDIVVYNLAGKEVAELHRGFLSRGIYHFEFDGSELPSGIYLYQVTTSQSTQTRKMILAK
jgi:hypothetical protein